MERASFLKVFLQHMKCYLPGNLIRNPMPRIFIGAHHISTPSAWHIPKFPTSRRKAGVQHKPYCLHSLGTMSHSHQRMVGTLLKSKFSGASQGPDLQAGLSMNISLRLLCQLFSVQGLFKERLWADWNVHELTVILTYQFYSPANIFPNKDN